MEFFLLHFSLSWPYTVIWPYTIIKFPLIYLYVYSGLYLPLLGTLTMGTLKKEIVLFPLTLNVWVPTLCNMLELRYLFSRWLHDTAHLRKAISWIPLILSQQARAFRPFQHFESRFCQVRKVTGDHKPTCLNICFPKKTWQEVSL